MNFVSCSLSLTHQKKVRRVGDFLWPNSLYIRMDRCREEDIQYSPGQLFESQNVGSLVSTKPLDRFLKDKKGAGSYHLVGKDVPAKRYITKEAIPAEQQRHTNCDLHKDILSKQFSAVQASYMDGLKVRAWYKHFEPTSTFAHRDLYEKKPAVVEKNTTEDI